VHCFSRYTPIAIPLRLRRRIRRALSSAVRATAVGALGLTASLPACGSGSHPAEAGASTASADTTVPLPPPFLGHWSLNDGTGQTAHDTSGQGLDGVLGSSPGVDPNDPTWSNDGPSLTFAPGTYVHAPGGGGIQTQHVGVELWLKDAGGSATSYALSVGPAGVAIAYGVLAGAGRVAFAVNAGPLNLGNFAAQLHQDAEFVHSFLSDPAIWQNNQTAPTSLTGGAYVADNGNHVGMAIEPATGSCATPPRAFWSDLLNRWAADLFTVRNGYEVAGGTMAGVLGNIIDFISELPG
jgi:hypothetical protein